VAVAVVVGVEITIRQTGLWKHLQGLSSAAGQMVFPRCLLRRSSHTVQ